MGNQWNWVLVLRVNSKGHGLKDGPHSSRLCGIYRSGTEEDQSSQYRKAREIWQVRMASTMLRWWSRSGLTMLSRHNVRIYQGIKLTRNSSRKARSQSSQLAESLWTDPGLKSGTGAGKDSSNRPQNPRMQGKSQHHRNTTTTVTDTSEFPAISFADEIHIFFFFPGKRSLSMVATEVPGWIREDSCVWQT